MSGVNHGYNTRHKDRNASFQKGSTSTSTSSSFKANSSSLSKAVSISDLTFFREHSHSERRGKVQECYSLKELASAVGVDSDSLAEKLQTDQHKQLNDHVAKAFMEALCNSIDPNLTVECNVEVEGMRYLPSLSSHPISRPDVVVFTSQKKGVALTAEVQSSPMLFAERKAVLAAADFLRLLRCTSDCTKVTTFALPNMQSQQCVVEIEISWENFNFVSNLKRYIDSQDGVRRIREVIRNQCNTLPHLPHTSSIGNSLITLSPNDCELLCGGPAHQIAARSHLMAKCNQSVYKIVYDAAEFSSIHLYMSKARDDAGMCLIKPMWVHLDSAPMLKVYKYDYVPISPLKPEQAKRCLLPLVLGINCALGKLHALELSHNDLRLENVCFNRQFEVVLIDMDRCFHISQLYPMFTSSRSQSSCMYDIQHLRKTGSQTDYFQLGWLIAWVLDHSGDYHDREWHAVDATIRNDPFISALIQGEFKKELLGNSIVSDFNSSLGGVLSQY